MVVEHEDECEELEELERVEVREDREGEQEQGSGGESGESASEDEPELISPVQTSDVPSVWVRGSKSLGHEMHRGVDAVPSLSLPTSYHAIEAKRISLSPTDPHASSVAYLFLQSPSPYNSTFTSSTSNFNKRTQAGTDIGSFPIHTPPPSGSDRTRTNSVSVKGLFNLKGWRERVQSASSSA